jgi:putative phosphoesterase
MGNRFVRRVAALYDVHGNQPALEAALADAESDGVELFVLGGDLALGPMPREVLDTLAGLGERVSCLRGNCDRLMVDAFDGLSLAPLPPSVRESIVWAAGQLDRRHRDFLAALPETLTVAVDGVGSVLFCHATPRSDDELFTARTPDERLRPIFAAVREPVVVCGHTHMQFHRRLGGLQLVNAGSVGMPFGAAGAHWLLLGPRIEPRRTTYDESRAVERIASTAYPNAADFATRYVMHPPSEEEMLTAFEASPRATRHEAEGE